MLVPSLISNVTNDMNSSPTMARCSIAKETGNPDTNMLAPGEPNPQVVYGP